MSETALLLSILLSENNPLLQPNDYGGICIDKMEYSF